MAPPREAVAGDDLAEPLGEQPADDDARERDPGPSDRAPGIRPRQPPPATRGAPPNRAPPEPRQDEHEHGQDVKNWCDDEHRPSGDWDDHIGRVARSREGRRGLQVEQPHQPDHGPACRVECRWIDPSGRVLRRVVAPHEEAIRDREGRHRPVHERLVISPEWHVNASRHEHIERVVEDAGDPLGRRDAGQSPVRPERWCRGERRDEDLALADRVHIDDGAQARQILGLGIVTRAEQPFLFRAEGGEHDGGRRWVRGQHPRRLQHHAHR